MKNHLLNPQPYLLLTSILFLTIMFATAFAPQKQEGLADTIKQWFVKLTAEQPEERIYIHTDRTVYAPGDTLWLSTYVRAGTLKPTVQSELVRLEWVAPNGAVQLKQRLMVADGKAAGYVAIPPEAAGGYYKLKVYSLWQQNDADPYLAEKEIRVERPVVPRVAAQLKLDNTGYTPGSKVELIFTLTDSKGNALANKQATASLSVAGEEVARQQARSNSEGKGEFNFDLPNDLATTDAVILLQLEHQGIRESFTKLVPVTLDKLYIGFFPEGGDIVAGLPARVAFEVANEKGEAAAATGDVRNSKGKVVAEFSTYYSGRGTFSFTPEAGEKYTAQLRVAGNNYGPYELPQVQAQGFVLKADHQQETVEVVIRGTVKGEMALIGQVRGEVFLAEDFRLDEEATTLRLPTAKLPQGVLYLTLFDAKKVARAERLIFVNRDKQLTVELTTSQSEYLPRQLVEATLKVRDENGLPMPGNFSVAVTDNNLHRLADDKQANILSALLLLPDVKGEVEKPNFYFDKEEEKAATALDHLLLTRAWRRFTWQQLEQAPLPRLVAEKAIISGIVYSYTGNQPVAGATVVLGDNADSVVTDATGRYTITNYPLTQPLQLSVTLKEAKAEVVVTDYGRDHDLRPMRWYAARGMPEAVQLQMAVEEVAEVEMADDEVQIVAAPAPSVAKVQKVAVDPEAEDINIGEAEEELQVDLDIEINDEIVIIDLPDDAQLDEVVVDFAQRVRAMPRPQPSEWPVQQVREFYRAPYPATAPVERTDFSKTLYWNPSLKTDRSGTATFRFPAADALSSYRIVTEGIATDGAVGRAEHVFGVSQPIAVNLKMPTIFTEGDELELQAQVVNNTNEPVTATLSASFSTTKFPAKTVKLAAAEGQVVSLGKMKFEKLSNQVPLELALVTSNRTDKISYQLKVLPKGFPVDVAFSANTLDTNFVVQTQQVVPGSMQAQLTAYPTIMDDLLAGVEKILREPHGCFEQTSSATYPNILVLDLLRESGKEASPAADKAYALIDKGYKKLVTFETEEKGYEWFGQTPAHEALTAYGLMEFVDMQRVYPEVNPQMVERTRNWLLSRRNGDGGFKQSAQALDQFGRADADITNAYIVYSLSEAGMAHDIQKEFTASVAAARATRDPYLLALMANAAFNLGSPEASSLLNLLNTTQAADGSFTGLRHSVTHSTGKALSIETTALALMAQIKAEQQPAGVIRSATDYLITNREAYGGYGNSQSTVLALKGLTAFARYAKRTKEAGELQFFVDGKKATEKAFAANHEGEILMTDLQDYLQPNQKLKLAVKYAELTEPIPYTFSLRYHTTLPPTSAEAPLHLSTQLLKNKAAVGELLRVQLKLRNTTAKGQPMSVARIGIPAGTTVDLPQLKKLQEEENFAYFELMENSIVFYWRDLAPSAEKSFSFDLKAQTIGTFTGSASSAYLYYTDEHKHWVEGLKVDLK